MYLQRELALVSVVVIMKCLLFYLQGYAEPASSHSVKTSTLV